MRAAREQQTAIVVAGPAVLGFDARDPVRRELIVGAALDAAEEAAGAQDAVVAGEAAAEMTADVEAGPVVDRRHIGRSLGVARRGAEVGCKCRRGRAESDDGHSSE